jgi:hypothetical protein
VQAGSISSGQGPAADSCEHSNETLGSIKGREVLELLLIPVVLACLNTGTDNSDCA